MKKQIVLGHKLFVAEEVKITQSQWNDYLEKARYTPVEQMFAYGVADALETGNKIKYIVFKMNNEVVAVAQALVYPVLFGMFKLVKVARGPVWLSEPLLPDVKLGVMTTLRKLYSRFLGKFVVFTVELEDIGLNQRLLSQAGFHHFAPGYKSAVVDITQSEKNLRAALQANWRNKLKKAEKNDVEIHRSSTKEDLDWMLTQYDLNLEEKQFYSVSSDFMRTMIDVIDNRDKQICLLVAKREGRPIAAILNFIHGQGATYHIGCTTAEGREYNAMRLLLWESVRALKKQNLKYFDVGGIHLDNKKGEISVGLTQFKQGLGGREYTLAGTFV